VRGRDSSGTPCQACFFGTMLPAGAPAPWCLGRLPPWARRSSAAHGRPRTIRSRRQCYRHVVRSGMGLHAQSDRRMTRVAYRCGSVHQTDRQPDSVSDRSATSAALLLLHEILLLQDWCLRVCVCANRNVSLWRAAAAPGAHQHGHGLLVWHCRPGSGRRCGCQLWRRDAARSWSASSLHLLFGGHGDAHAWGASQSAPLACCTVRCSCAAGCAPA
jgi:hypothetical protein